MIKRILVAFALLLSACVADDLPNADRKTAEQQATVVVLAEGLQNPVGLAMLADGSILIAEEGTGEGDNSGGVSLLTPDGRLGRVITGFPSRRDSGDLAGVALVGVSPDDSTLYVGHFGTETLLTLNLGSTELVPGQPLSLYELGSAMAPLNNVRLTNPFDITFADNGRPVVADSIPVCTRVCM